MNQHGNPQNDGSEAKNQIMQDILDCKHEEMSKKDWFFRDFFNNMLLKQFRDCVKQEFETAKYLHTLHVEGKVHKAS